MVYILCGVSIFFSYPEIANSQRISHYRNSSCLKGSRNRWAQI
jgi:hypothetical protein